MLRTHRAGLKDWILAGVLLACCACSSEPAPGSSTGGAGGTPSGGGGSGGSAAGAGGQTGGSAGAVMGGAGGAGATGGAGTGGGGAGGTGGGAGSAGQGGGGPVVLAGCANNDYPICIDFESGIDDAVWDEGSEGAITTDEFAHGTASYHAYSRPTGAPRLVTTQLGPITNVLWGRFYLRLSPGAPGGHGNIMAAHEGSNWYELGWQFNGLMGVWHWDGGENPLRSMPTIVDQWYCVEFLFDGTKNEMPKWYVDGTEVSYYMGEPNNMKPELITQFDQLDIGFTTYAGLGLNPEPYGNDDMPHLTDMWLDDIAFDVERIGCITQ